MLRTSELSNEGRIRVIHVTSADISLRIGLFTQLQELRRTGYEVMGACSQGPYGEWLRESGIPLLDVSISRRITPVRDVISLWLLYRLFRRVRPTIVHTHNPKPGLLGQLAARLAGVPIVVNTLHGFYFNENSSPMQRLLYVFLEKVAAHCSDVILSQNREDINTALTRHICPREKIKYLGNGIDLSRFDPTHLDELTLNTTRAELGLAVDAPVIGFVGRLVTEKGILELLAAAQTVRQRIPSVQFLFIGPIDYEKADALRPEVASDYGLKDACVFAGQRFDMPELYALMNVFVLPSHREGFPRSPMEASAMGVPSVVTNVRGCREAVEHGRNGLVVPLGDIPALANAVIELLTDLEKARQLGIEGQRIACERFDERVLFDKIKTEYARLLQARNLPVPSPRLEQRL